MFDKLPEGYVDDNQRSMVTLFQKINNFIVNGPTTNEDEDKIFH